MPFDPTGEADHCAALRLIPALRRVLLLMSGRTVVLRISRWTVWISISSIVGRRLRLIAGLRRRRVLRVSLVAAELIGRLRLAMILSGRILLKWVLRRVLSSWSHSFDFCFVRVRLKSGTLDGFSAV